MKHMSTRDTLMAFGEWLDSQGLVMGNFTGGPVDDNRSHEDLATEFIQHWEADERGALLAGREVEEETARDGGGNPIRVYQVYSDMPDLETDEMTEEDRAAHMVHVKATPEVCRDFLLLVAPSTAIGQNVMRQALPLLRSVSQKTRNQIAGWASAVHLEASDNDVDVPPMPKILETFGFQS